jgi:hypothetical protein
VRGAAAGAPAPVPGVATNDSGSVAVEVVASGTVGPYDYTQIAVNPDDADPAQAAIDWLLENGFDVGKLGPEVLRPYLEDDMNLLAFRLTKGNDSGSIRPVMITYPGKRPLIPIRPTAVAANEDMGILVWVLGSARAVPTTYLDLELNDARINWFDPNPTYNDVVIQAADEAGGKGFVTEQSGPAGMFSQTVYPDWKDDEFTQLRSATFASLQEFLQAAQSVAQSHFYPSLSRFGGPLGDAAVAIGQNQYDGFLDVLSDPEVVPLREGATPEQLNTCVSCYFQVDVPVRNDAFPSTPFDPATDPLLDMDVQAFLDKMQELVIDPLRTTRALFEDHAHVTRLYTTMSADEMDTDPEFDLNPELEDVSNVHTASRVFQCNGNDWTIDLPSGISLTGSGSTWPVAIDDQDMPFNVRVLQLSTSGQGEVLIDNTDLVVSRLSDLGLSDVLPGGPSAVDLSDPGLADADAGANTSGTGPSAANSEANTRSANEARASNGGCALSAPAGSARSGHFWSLLTLAVVWVWRRRRHSAG